ncbi:GerAB/ArcD/ProY family transporter [Halalkalibacter akibai]|uniref:Spore germination protein n=1 Tax=Halalkalibacter akibai (strain ATCC 43226 / DSM 21942 / CIP 109018 / JCM 9157 / 1139) TaxID=1236973 RepID=W4QQA5_HALA3|nr:GerAB/ArcD/ProY family transporter [Halalkalibacter akibai]GAE34261.1 spore germination protein [Halalkalibacter akibai JCM 9157]
MQSVVLPGFQVLPLTVSLFFVMSCIVAGGIKSVARFCIFSFFMTGWMVIFLQWPLQAGNWLHAVPTFEVSYTDWLEALHEGALSMFGYGLLMFYYPYIQNQKKVFLHTSIGIWLAVLFYLIVSIAAVVYFSAWQLDNLLFPVLNLFQAIKLTFVERIENFGTTLWVFLVLSTSSAYLWVAKKGMDALTNKHKDRVWHISVVAFLSWLLVSGPIPMDIQVIIFDEWSVFYGYGLLLYPIFLLVINYIKRKLTKKEPKEQEVST